MKGTYGWDLGFSFRVNAEVLGRTLEQLEERLGRQPKTAEIREEARPPKSPIHAICTWDDQQAAENYRLIEIRNAVNHLVFVRSDGVVQQAFVSVVTSELEDGQNIRGYTTLAGALANPDMRRRMVEEAWAGLESWRHRYDHLKEFADIQDAIDEKKAAKAKGRRRKKEGLSREERI